MISPIPTIKEIREVLTEAHEELITLKADNKQLSNENLHLRLALSSSLSLLDSYAAPYSDEARAIRMIRAMFTEVHSPSVRGLVLVVDNGRVVMEESKPTPGPVISRNMYVVQRGPLGLYVADCSMTDEGDANAGLVAEAFNVLTETGLTPRQLAEALEIARKQRAELLAALKNIVPRFERCILSTARNKNLLTSRSHQPAPPLRKRPGPPHDP